MRRVHFSLSIGLAGAERKTFEVFEDGTTDEEIEQAYQEWCQNYMDGGWWEEDAA